MSLFGPESVFWGPGSEPFINISFWEVFWRPETGDMHFLQKKVGNFAPKPEFAKKAVFA